MALVRSRVTIAAIKNVRTTIGSTPARTNARVTGTNTLVSSVTGNEPNEGVEQDCSHGRNGHLEKKWDVH